jgi:hypothetical protein
MAISLWVPDVTDDRSVRASANHVVRWVKNGGKGFAPRLSQDRFARGKMVAIFRPSNAGMQAGFIAGIVDQMRAPVASGNGARHEIFSFQGIKEPACAAHI